MQALEDQKTQNIQSDILTELVELRETLHSELAGAEVQTGLGNGQESQTTKDLKKSLKLSGLVIFLHLELSWNNAVGEKRP